jgi:hypothetical protein
MAEAPTTAATPAGERRYTCQQAAAILGLPFDTVIALCNAGLIGHLVVGPRSERYSLRIITQLQLDEFIERTSVPLNDVGSNSYWGKNHLRWQAGSGPAERRSKQQEAVSQASSS